MKVKFNLKGQLILPLLIFFALFEVLCSTFFIKPVGDILKSDDYKLFLTFDNNNIVTIFYFISGLAIAILPLIKVNKNNPTIVSRNTRWFILSIIAILTVYLFTFGIINLASIFEKDPINYLEADMLPIMKVLNERWLSNQKEYTPILSIRNEHPVYMPAMWMPFMSAIIGKFDMRWITLCLLYIGVLLILFNIQFKKLNWTILASLTPLFVLLYFILCQDQNLLRYTEEAIVVFYYLLLATAILNDNPIFLSFAIMLCGLSRFSFLGWVFFLIPFVFFKISKTKAIKILSYTVLFVLLLLIISRSIGSFWFFVNTNQYYLNFFYDTSAKPAYIKVILAYLGFAKFFPFDSLTILLYIQYALTFLFPIIGFIIFKKIKNIDSKWFLLCMLKLALVLFYDCMILPWSYLFYPSTFLSSFILIRYAVERKKTSSFLLP